MPESFETRIQRLAEKHLAACNDAMIDFDEGNQDTPSPAYGPYDGCDTCIVREVLSVAWDEMIAEARRQARVEAGLIEDEEWFVPGGAIIDSSRRVKMRLRPPHEWRKVEIDIPRVPPSMNDNKIRSNWRGFQAEKKSWQTEIELMLMTSGLKRRGYQRAMVGGFVRFAASAARRDPGNYAGLVNKACGDALVNFDAIPDDDGPHYFFGGVEIEDEPGPDRTRLWIYLQPNEED